MPVLQNNKYHHIFWGKGSQYITGLDPLGLKSSSQGIYSYLLNGITNVSNRLRYFSFYCWLFDYYAEDIRHTDPQMQKNFIRKADLILVLLMKTYESKVTDITGSELAVELVFNNKQDYYDLDKYAIQRGENKTYFNNPFGAFGQYYIGPMKDLILVKVNDYNNYICTEDSDVAGISGEELSRSFKKSISEENLNLFIESIHKGRLFKKDMEKLHQDFSTSAIPLEGVEWQTLLDMLLQSDHIFPLDLNYQEQTYHRKETIKLLLQSFTISNRTGYDTMLNEIYIKQRHEGLKDSETWNLWYAYRLNDFYQFACGAIFFVMQKELEQKSPLYDLQRFIDGISDLTLNALLEKENIHKKDLLKHFLEKEHLDELYLLGEIYNLNQTKQSFETIATAFELIFSLFHSNKDKLSALFDLFEKYPLLDEGNVLQTLHDISSFQGSIDSYIKSFITREIIYRHHYNGIRKMRGNQNSLKFILEEGTITYINNFGFGFSSPRLGALQNILADLKLVNENEITAVGSKVLKNLRDRT